MFRSVLSCITIVLVLASSNPYVTISSLLGEVDAVLYWDAMDQDEDLFVSLTDGEDDDLIFQEESKRDGDKKGKLKLKQKFPTMPAIQWSFLNPVFETCVVIFPETLERSYLLHSFFHPPNFLA